MRDNYHKCPVGYGAGEYLTWMCENSGQRTYEHGTLHNDLLITIQREAHEVLLPQRSYILELRDDTSNNNFVTFTAS